MRPYVVKTADLFWVIVRGPLTRTLIVEYPVALTESVTTTVS